MHLHADLSVLGSGKRAHVQHEGVRLPHGLNHHGELFDLFELGVQKPSQLDHFLVMHALPLDQHVLQALLLGLQPRYRSLLGLQAVLQGLDLKGASRGLLCRLLDEASPL